MNQSSREPPYIYKEEVVTSKLHNNLRQNTDETWNLENRYSPAKFKPLQTLYFYLFRISQSKETTFGSQIVEGNKPFELFPKFGQ